MQHFLYPTPARLGRQLEHRAVAISTATGRRAVEIAGGIEDHTGLRGVPVLEIEGMQHLHFPVSAIGRQLEHRAGAVGTTGGRAVEIAGVIEDHTGHGTPAVPAAECMQVLLLGCASAGLE
jgi:hypothetical protein